MAVPRGRPTAAWFEWGTDGLYQNTTEPVATGAGFSVVRVSSPIGPLVEGAVYQCRLVASNASGIKRGYTQQFTTGMKIQNWGSYTLGRPAVPHGLSNLVAVAAGHGHCLVLRNDGTVAAYMVFYSYENVGQADVPPGLTNIVALAGGYSHSLALKEDGTVVAWGKYGRSGVHASVPPGLTNVIAIAGGDYHSLALKSDGTLAAWGSVTSGQATVPFGLKDVVAIACGTSHNIALKADGTLSVWGDYFTPPAPSTAINVVAVAAEGRYNLALCADSTVVDWGTVQPDIPKPVLTNIAAIATGYGYGVATKTDGTLVAWGRAVDVTNVPPALTNVVALASGDYHCLALAPVNLSPKCYSSRVTRPMNTDGIVNLSAFDGNGDSLSVTISALPAQGSLFQYVDGQRGDPITAPGTVLTDPTRVIFAPEQDGFWPPLRGV